MTHAKRRTLALKLTAAGVLANLVLVCLFFDSPEPAPAPVASGVVLKLRGELMTPFERFKKVTLVNERGLRLGPVELLEDHGDAVQVALPPELYQQHFHHLTHDHWRLLPQVQEAPRAQGANYEIAY